MGLISAAANVTVATASVVVAGAAVWRTCGGRCRRPASTATATTSRPPSPPSPPPTVPAAAAARAGAVGEVALVDTALRELVAAPGVFGFGHDLLRFVQPASIDVPLSGTAWMVKEKVLPFRKRVRELLPDLVLEERSLTGEGSVLLRGQTYLVFCGTVSLPAGHRGLLSPKSSIGRVDLMVRMHRHNLDPAQRQPPEQPRPN
jgi:deoxycytidine triphosphate deaminase